MNSHCMETHQYLHMGMFYTSPLEYRGSLTKPPRHMTLLYILLLEILFFFSVSIVLLHICPCSYFKHTEFQSMVGEDHSRMGDDRICTF